MGFGKLFFRNVFLGYFNEKELRNKESSTVFWVGFRLSA
jgi:hypothetical protein